MVSSLFIGWTYFRLSREGEGNGGGNCAGGGRVRDAMTISCPGLGPAPRSRPLPCCLLGTWKNRHCEQIGALSAQAGQAPRIGDQWIHSLFFRSCSGFTPYYGTFRSGPCVPSPAPAPPASSDWPTLLSLTSSSAPARRTRHTRACFVTQRSPVGISRRA